MLSLSQIAQALGRDRVQVLGLIKRFELPTFAGSSYPETYLSFLRSLVFLRLAQIPEERLLELWNLERKIMALLHADTLGSPTWMVDGHTRKGGASRRLFLSRHDLGTQLSAMSHQPDLDFSATDAELFEAGEMGEDLARVLRSYLECAANMRRHIAEQAPTLRAAARWAGKFAT